MSGVECVCVSVCLSVLGMSNLCDCSSVFLICCYCHHAHTHTANQRHHVPFQIKPIVAAPFVFFFHKKAILPVHDGVETMCNSQHSAVAEFLENV